MRTYRKFVVIIMIALVISSCLKDEPFKDPYEGFQPVSRNDGWIASTPENEGMDRSLVEEAYQLMYKDTRFTMARSFLIIRNGKLIAEAYPHDTADHDRIANIQSMTKSFTSILTGIALKERLLDSVNQTFYSIYPEWFASNPEKKEITLKQALTMTTGIDFNNSEDTQTLYQTTTNSVEFVLSRPENYEPGIVFHYHDGAPHLVSAAIQKQFGKPFSEFANQYLFHPLGITDWKWEAANDGNTFGAFSLYLKPRDVAKFGQLLLQHGNWKGQSIVDSAWGYTSGEFFDNFNELADLILRSCS